MFDESKPIKAKDIVENPDAVYSLNYAYMTLEDGSSITGSTKFYLDALEILYHAGYEAITFAHSGIDVRILLFNTNAKRKNK